MGLSSEHPPFELERARRSIAGGHHLLAGGFLDEAGRSAYLGAFHAAQTLTIARTGKQPNTHRGARTEFARLARDEPKLPLAYAAFLANSYELKTVADYEGDNPVARDVAEAALTFAVEMIEAIALLLP